MYTNCFHFAKAAFYQRLTKTGPSTRSKSKFNYHLTIYYPYYFISSFFVLSILVQTIVFIGIICSLSLSFLYISLSKNYFCLGKLEFLLLYFIDFRLFHKSAEIILIFFFFFLSKYTSYPR